MDNVINQSTVINGEKSKVIIGKDLTGQTLTGRYTLIGCMGTVSAAGTFCLWNCSNLIVTDPYLDLTVIRDGYNIGDYLFTSVVNPADIYGGYWEEVPQGTFLMAAGAGGTVDQTGGEATHTLTIEEMPSHSHDIVDVGLDWNTGNHSYVVRYEQVQEKSRSLQVSNTGGGQAHNNLPPYRTAHIFKRIKDPTTGNL